MIDLNRLKGLSAFHGVAPAALERLAQHLVARSVADGEVICREGEASQAIYLIASGRAVVKKRLASSSDEQKVVARLNAEESFGEMAFLDQAPHSASVIADGPVELFLLPRAVLNDLIKKDPAFALDQVVTLMSGLSVRLRRTTTELITVFEVARFVGSFSSVEKLVDDVLRSLRASVGTATLAFYRWNPFNDEYALIKADGADAAALPALIEAKEPLLGNVDGLLASIEDIEKERPRLKPLQYARGHLLLSSISMMDAPEGLLIIHHPEARALDSGVRQLVESVAGVLAPALSTARAREEELARQRLQRSRQENLY